MREKPYRVWTLWAETDPAERPVIPENLVHGDYASLEDEGHDWQFFLGKYRHASRVRDRSVWVVCEYLTAVPEPVGDPIVLMLALTAREVNLLRRELEDTEGSLWRMAENREPGDFWVEELHMFRGLVEKLGGLRPPPHPSPPRVPSIKPKRGRRR